MSVWQEVAEKLRQWRQPTPRQVLLAHLDALRADPEAAAAPEGRVSLPMAEGAGPRCLAVELGLSRVEAYLETGDRLRIECPSDALLLFNPVDAAKRAVLDRLNWKFQQSKGVMQSTVPIGNRGERLAACGQIEQLLVQVLESQGGAHYSCALERRRSPDNSALIAQIKKLVLNRDMESRRVVYQSIVQGLFFLPVATGPNPEDFPAPKAWRYGEDQRPVWAIFSGRDSVPKTCRDPLLTLSGIRLVQAAMVHDVGGLLLNPDARYGGELYRHELDSLAGYLRSIGLLNIPGPTSTTPH